MVAYDLQNLVPWTILYIKDIMIAENKADLEYQAQAWSDCLVMFCMCLNVNK
ncbi:hypothetical protein JRQ81_012610, partial [Phrynocephalus forsythii]